MAGVDYYAEEIRRLFVLLGEYYGNYALYIVALGYEEVRAFADYREAQPDRSAVERQGAAVELEVEARILAVNALLFAGQPRVPHSAKRRKLRHRNVVHSVEFCGFRVCGGCDCQKTGQKLAAR